MITATQREGDFRITKEEEESNTFDIGKKYSKPSSSTTSTPWSRLKDPRIVRVSRAFGGKDRHSKVCTVKGLRDRRVRLSVPTAIQLYDLQERLGFNQPSKVVDWLLNAAKLDIDELPPLQIPLGAFDHHSNDQILPSSRAELDSSNRDGITMLTNVSRESNYWNSDKFEQVIPMDRTVTNENENWNQRNEENENWNQRNEEEAEEEEEEEETAAPRSNYHNSIPGLLNNVVPYNSIYRWDPSICSLSHFTPQTDDHPHNFNVVQLPSVPLSLPSGSQLLVCPTVTTQTYFPSHVGNNLIGFDPKEINNFQMLSSTSQTPSFPNIMKPFQLSMAPNLLPSLNSSGSQSKNDDEFSPQ